VHHSGWLLIDFVVSDEETKFYGIGTRMMGRKTVARLSSFLLISPMLVELISFGLFRLAFPLGLGLL
jgi:hypothetical protein